MTPMRVAARATLLFSMFPVLLAGCNSSDSPSSPTSQPPQLTSLAPASGNQGATLSVNVTGNNFVTSATNTLALSGTGITISNVAIPNASTATATLTIASDAPLGQRSLTITSSGATSSSINFTVTAAAPALINIAPNSALAGSGVVATLTGSGFVSGATLALAGVGVSVSDVTVVSSTSITARFTVDAAAEFGARSVTVTSAGATTSAQTFTVGAPGPALTAITPSSGVPGTTVNVTLAGTAFVPGATTVAISGSGITIANVNGPLAAATGRSLSAAFVIDAIASLGPRTVTITTPGGSSASTFTVGAPAPTIGSFSASPGIINPGQSTTLAWTGIKNATNCSINIGVGAVTCADSNTRLSPTSTTEYQLMAIGPAGREWMYVTVNVEGLPVSPPVASIPPSGNQTFIFTGGAQTFVVPAGVNQITVEAFGAQGGAGIGTAPGTGGSGGLGGRIQATIAVVPGTTYQINVGGQGGTAVAHPGGGGGGSDVRTGANTLNDRVVVAGAGGGGAGASAGGAPVGGAGGAGGGLTGGTGGTSSTNGIGGNGGSQVAGGTASAGTNPGQAGTLGQGGSGCCVLIGGAGGFNGGGTGGPVFTGGSGGGGYYGGGGGSDDGGGTAGGGGGAGSSFANGTNVTHAQGVRSGNGMVTITW